MKVYNRGKGGDKMKIKAVCEETGLTDRAVRYYIDEGLIKPEFTENYVGRRSYDFSFEDISLLSDISTLRKFGFTVAEVKDIILDPRSSVSVIQKVRERKYYDIQNNAAAITALENMDFTKPYTVPQLAAELENFTRFAPLPAEDDRLSNRTVVRLIVYIIAGIFGSLLLIPFLILFFWSIDVLNIHEYPSFNKSLFCLALLLITSPLTAVILFKLIVRKRSVIGGLRNAVYVLTYFCVIAGILVFVVLSVGSVSETNDMKNYLEFGKDEWAEYDYVKYTYVLELFPDVPFEKENASDPKYHYLYVEGFKGGGTFEMFAEWTLDEETFDAEVERIRSGFAQREGVCILDKGGYTVISETKDLFRFEILNFEIDENGFPEDYDNNSPCNFFAYNEKTGSVRYYYVGRDLCDIGTYFDKPYYAGLEW